MRVNEGAWGSTSCPEFTKWHQALWGISCRQQLKQLVCDIAHGVSGCWAPPQDTVYAILSWRPPYVHSPTHLWQRPCTHTPFIYFSVPSTSKFCGCMTRPQTWDRNTLIAMCLSKHAQVRSTRFSGENGKLRFPPRGEAVTHHKASDQGADHVAWQAHIRQLNEQRGEPGTSTPLVHWGGL